MQVKNINLELCFELCVGGGVIPIIWLFGDCLGWTWS